MDFPGGSDYFFFWRTTIHSNCLVIAAILNIDHLLGCRDTEDVGHRLANNHIVLDADSNALILFGVRRVSWNVQTGLWDG